MAVKNTFYEKITDFKQLALLHDDETRRVRIHRAKCSTSNALVSLKSYANDSTRVVARSAVEREIELTAQPGCPFIQQCFDHFVDIGRRWLVQEYCAGGSLRQILLNYHSDIEEGWLASQVVFLMLQTLDFLHEKGIVHTRVFPEHILFNSGKVAKLTAFEDACSVGARCSGFTADDFAYLSPEQLTASAPHADPKMDVWALGVVAYESLFGTTPFAHADPGRHRQNVLTGQVLFRWEVSEAFTDFVQRALCCDSGERATAAELLAHPWIQSNLMWEPSMDFEDPIDLSSDLKSIYVQSAESVESDRKPSCVGQSQSLGWRIWRHLFNPRDAAHEPHAEDPAPETEMHQRSFRVVMDQPSMLKKATMPAYVGYRPREPDSKISRAPYRAHPHNEVSFAVQTGPVEKTKTPRVCAEDEQQLVTNPTPPPNGEPRPFPMRTPSIGETETDGSERIYTGYDQDSSWMDDVETMLNSNSTSL